MERLENFNHELLNVSIDENDELLNFIRKRVIHGTPYVFKDNEDGFYEFRKRISEKWDVLFYDIYITGSAKLGFSYYKEKPFDEESDVDVAIISIKLYEKILTHIEDFQWKLRNKQIQLSEEEMKKYHKFLKYLVIGWIRPDMLPIQISDNNLGFKKDWFSFFDSISNGKSEVGNYKVAAGVYKSYSHLERYILNGVKSHYQRICMRKNYSSQESQ